MYVYCLKLEHNKYYIGKTINHPSIRLQEHLSGTGSKWTSMHKPIEILEIIANCDHYDEDKYTLKYMNKYDIENVRGGSFVQIDISSSKQMIEKMLISTSDKCFKCNKVGHFADVCDNFCMRCKRIGHDIKKCYAKKDIDGNSILCNRCGRNTHYEANCYAKSHIKNDIKKLKNVNYMISNQYMIPGQSITSDNGEFTFMFQSDGNCVITQNSDMDVIWSTGTENQNALRLYLQDNASLNLSNNDDGSGSIWSSTGSDIGMYRFQIRDDGVVEVINFGDEVPGNLIWKSHNNLEEDIEEVKNAFKKVGNFFKSIF